MGSYAWEMLGQCLSVKGTAGMVLQVYFAIVTVSLFENVL